MALTVGNIEVERDGETLILTPRTDLRELDYRSFEAATGNIMELVSREPVRNVVVDFHRVDYCGSTALGFFLRLLKRVRERGGRMAFCRLSGHLREILDVTRLSGLWPIYSSPADAITAVRGQAV